MTEELLATLQHIKESGTILNGEYYVVHSDFIIALEEETQRLNNVLNELEKKLQSIKFYIEQSGIKNMLWGKEILKIIGEENE